MNRSLLTLLLSFISLHIACNQEYTVEPSNPIVNQEFKVTLPTNRFTGYDWYFTGIVKQVSPAHLLVPLEPPFIKAYGDPQFTVTNNVEGKKETKIFTFIARRPGAVTLHFEQKHRYKTGKKVRASKDINIPIKEK
jgi:hypothetical protein